MPPRDNTQPAATGTAKITGRVIAADTGMPVRRAQIRVASSEARLNRVVTTDGDGRYELLNLPAGRYRVSVTRAGYVSLEYGQARPFESGKPLDLANGQTIERLDFSLPRGSVIAGRITDEFGDPMTDVQVQAMRYRSSESASSSTPAAPLKQTIWASRISGPATTSCATLRQNPPGPNAADLIRWDVRHVLSASSTSPRRRPSR
jgi:hypothetical protein